MNMDRTTPWRIILLLVVIAALLFGINSLLRQGVDYGALAADEAIRQGDLETCSGFRDEAEECFRAAYPVLATSNTCDMLPENLQGGCMSYTKAIEWNREGFSELRNDFEYEEREVTVSFADGERATFQAWIAGEPAQRIQGLSYREWIEENQAMLFAFSEPGTYPFHMKGMGFSLDILFLDAEGTVLGQYRNLPSCLGLDSCEKVGEDLLGVKYVLEYRPRGRDAASVDLTKLLQDSE